MSELRRPDWGTERVDAAWRQMLDAYLASPLGEALRERVAASDVSVFPPRPFRALELTPLASVRVVILGQDPYHTPGKAEGLAFSVPTGERMPPSLRNIFKEIAAETGEAPRSDTSLVDWAEAGVLLLNTLLTVEEGRPMSHRGLWEPLTDQLIRRVSAECDRVVFLLWGAPAQEKRPLIDESRHAVLVSNHPSPLSASRGRTPFLGNGHFAQANALLTAWGKPPVVWGGAAEATLF